MKPERIAELREAIKDVNSLDVQFLSCVAVETLDALETARWARNQWREQAERSRDAVVELQAEVARLRAALGMISAAEIFEQNNVCTTIARKALEGK